VLGELENRLQDLSQIVLGGRRELMRLQGKDTSSPSPTSHHSASPGDPSQGMDPSGAVRGRAQQAANRLRRAAGGRLAS
jgi:hypothetical protein